MGSATSAEYKAPAEVESRVFPEFKATLPHMTGKVVAITGCTTGIGYVCAKTCAELGAQVVMINRPSQRANMALADLQHNYPGGRHMLIKCDLTSFASVREAGAKLRKDLAKSGLDVLCNNAGIMATKDEATVDGFDTQMQVNHLSHFLLTAEVWPLLEKAATKKGEARVVNHSSEARKGKPLDSKYLNKNGGNLGGDKAGWTLLGGARWQRYQQAKLANVAFTYGLNDRLQASGSTIKALVAHPGLAATNLQVNTVRDDGMSARFADWLVRYGAQSSEDGAVGLLTCCCSSDVTSGQFWGPGGLGLAGPAKPLPEESFADEASRAMLWADSNWATNATFNP